jgi:hypothetical protein
MRPLALIFLLCTAAIGLSAQPTFSTDVAPIMQAKCQGCHRPGDIAPFPLMTYDDASTWADDIQRVVSQKIMPPWKPVPGHGDFRGDYGLTDAERQTILDWVAAGIPQGDPANMPAPLPETGPWQLGDPDLVLQMAQVFTVPRKQDTYRCFVIPSGLTEDKWVTGVQVLPGNKQIVHHVILYVDQTGASDKLDGQDGNPGYDCYGGPGFDLFSGGNLVAALNLTASLGGWVPGSRVQPLPDGVGMLLTKDSRIVMQVHYFPNGRPGPDQTQIGLYFAKTPIQQRMRYFPLVNTTFQIPPGDADYQVTNSFTVPFFLDAHAVQIVPHMHLLGRKIRVTATQGDQSSDMVYIDDWDFNWQGFYTYKTAVALPAGTTVKLTCEFDNTADNAKNPNDPLKVVTWGEGTQDEMCLAFMGLTFDREQLTMTSRDPLGKKK